MKKTYEPETKSAIEQVIDVFNDYTNIDSF